MARKQNSHLEISYTGIETLKLNPRNPRVHTDKQVRQIARSIEQFGFNVPILVDGALSVIAGHGRVLAARLLGMKKVPAIRLEHLTDAQRQAFLIADNRLCENSQWDERLLGEQLQILAASDLDFNLEVTGFEMGEIDLMVEGLKAGDEADPADELPETGPAVSKPGDIWCLGKHRVFCGSSLERASYTRLMGSKKAAIVFADPPYNLGLDRNVRGFGRVRYREFSMGSGEMSDASFREFLRSCLENAVRQSVSGSIHFVCMDWRHMSHLLAVGSEVYSEFKNLCVWSKGVGGQGSLYRSAHELVFVFKAGKDSHRNNIQLGKFGRYRTNVWEYPATRAFGRGKPEDEALQLHPTPKPVALVSDAILDCSARGDLVLDPFLGSGTSVIAAERTGRVCYGLEIDPLYIDTAVRRWQALTGLSATHEVTGESFRALEEAAHA